MAPEVLDVVPVHTFFSVYVQPVPPAKPVLLVVVEIVVLTLPQLNSATARSPLASGLARTSAVPFCDTMPACLPRLSWSIATRPVLPAVAIALASIAATSTLRISGAAIIDHSAICERYSSAVTPVSPVIRKSGSFQWFGPAYRDSGTL